MSKGGVSSPPSHVGQMGNADPWKYWQWESIVDASVTSTPTLDTTFTSCTGLPTSLNLQFLWAYVGEGSNAQAKIVAVRKSVGVDTWVFSREDARNTLGTTKVEKQNFALTTTVTWVQYPGQAPTTLVAAPPITVPPLPSDLWYPFGT